MNRCLLPRLYLLWNVIPYIMSYIGNTNCPYNNKLEHKLYLLAFWNESEKTIRKIKSNNYISFILCRWRLKGEPLIHLSDKLIITPFAMNTSLGHYWFTVKYRKAIIKCQDTSHSGKHNFSLFNLHVQNCWCSSIDVCLLEKVRIGNWKLTENSQEK